MVSVQVPEAKTKTSVRVTEVFASVQGETSRIGLPTVFIRLTGCPLRCVWCDTEYAFHGGRAHDIQGLISEVATYGLRHVCVTGGEPLAQKPCLELLAGLCDEGFSVSLETSGALDISGVDARVSRIVDLKAPGSGETERNRWENLEHLRPTDELKIVLADEADYAWARARVVEHDLADRCVVLFSPVHGRLDAAALAEWIVRDRLPVRFQTQLHKILWLDARGR